MARGLNDWHSVLDQNVTKAKHLGNFDFALTMFKQQYDIPKLHYMCLLIALLFSFRCRITDQLSKAKEENNFCSVD